MIIMDCMSELLRYQATTRVNELEWLSECGMVAGRA